MLVSAYREIPKRYFMLCANCSKLSFSNKKKTCIKCQGEIDKSIAVLCDFCSLSDKKCAACLKRVSEYYLNKGYTRSCGCHK